MTSLEIGVTAMLLLAVMGAIFAYFVSDKDKSDLSSNSHVQELEKVLCNE